MKLQPPTEIYAWRVKRDRFGLLGYPGGEIHFVKYNLVGTTDQIAFRFRLSQKAVSAIAQFHGSAGSRQSTLAAGEVLDPLKDGGPCAANSCKPSDSSKG